MQRDRRGARPGRRSSRCGWPQGGPNGQSSPRLASETTKPRVDRVSHAVAPTGSSRRPPACLYPTARRRQQSKLLGSPDSRRCSHWRVGWSSAFPRHRGPSQARRSVGAVLCEARKEGGSMAEQLGGGSSEEPQDVWRSCVAWRRSGSEGCPVRRPQITVIDGVASRWRSSSTVRLCSSPAP
jgi:hypothetical protein